MDCNYPDSLPDYDAEFRSLLPYRLAQCPNLGNAAVNEIRQAIGHPAALPMNGCMSIQLQYIDPDSPHAVPILLLEYGSEPYICWAENFSLLDTLSDLAEERLGITRLVITSRKGTYRHLKENGHWILDILVSGGECGCD